MDTERDAISLRRTGAAATPPRRPILGLDRVGEFERDCAELSVYLGDLGCVGPSHGSIEARDSSVESLPQLGRAAPPRARAKLVWRLAALAARKRAPGQSQLGRIPGDGRLPSRRFSEPTKTAGETCIGGSEAMGPHRLAPLVLGLVKPLEQRAFAGFSHRRIQNLSLCGGHARALARDTLFGIREPSPALLPAPCRRSRAALKTGEQLFEVFATDAPDLANTDPAQHAFFDPRPHRLRRHRQPPRDLTDGHELWFLIVVRRHAKYR